MKPIGFFLRYIVLFSLLNGVSVFDSANHPSVSNWYSLNMTSSEAYINELTMRGGQTQIRLWFSVEDNTGGVANFLRLHKRRRENEFQSFQVG